MKANIKQLQSRLCFWRGVLKDIPRCAPAWFETKGICEGLKEAIRIVKR